MDQNVQEVGKQKDVNKEDIESYNKFEENICIKKRKSLSLIQKRERRSESIHLGADEEEIYQTVKVTVIGHFEH